MKRSGLIIAIAAIIGLGISSPGWAAYDDKSDGAALAVLGLTLFAAEALSSESFDDRRPVHYRHGRHYDRYDRHYGRYHKRYDRRHSGYNRIERKLNKCLNRAYRYNRSVHKCHRKAEKRYDKQQRRHYRNRYY